MDETIGRNVSLSDSDFNLCLRTAVQPSWLWTTRIYVIILLLTEKTLFKIHKNLWSFPSLPIVGSEESFKKFYISLIISYRLDIYIGLLTITTPLPLSGFVISMSLFCLSCLIILCLSIFRWFICINIVAGQIGHFCFYFPCIFLVLQTFTHWPMDKIKRG